MKQIKSNSIHKNVLAISTQYQDFLTLMPIRNILYEEKN